jgi:hypothetical protein
MKSSGEKNFEIHHVHENVQFYWKITLCQIVQMLWGNQYSGTFQQYFACISQRPTRGDNQRGAYFSSEHDGMI